MTSSKSLTSGISGTTILLVGLSLAIGWGIRGNFGHEYGSAFAGSLAAIAIALLAGREDWQKRAPYFAFFGALGWGFGASQSYMQVLSYSDSGHAASQLYGYLSLFVIGFLWAGMGGAGTAFAGVATREQLVKIFRPLFFAFGAWLLLDIIEGPIAAWMQSGIDFDGTWSRHKNPLYWFDSDYLAAFFALLGIGIYDLVQRKEERNRFLLPAFIIGGALLGWGIQALLQAAGVLDSLASALTYLQGDPSYVNPVTGQHDYDASNMLNNWPQWFGDYPQHVGWVIGTILGITAYFIRFGKFRNGSSLFVYMAGGFLISFLALPVLGGIFLESYGGLRMTPPRGDNWAGILGVFAGTSIWMWRNKLKPAAIAALVSGIIGGLSLPGIQWLRQCLVSFGNPRILEAKGILPGSYEFIEKTSRWADWQAQNWHSFLEQSYGFMNGVAIAVALGFIALRVKIPVSDLSEKWEKKERWALAFSALFVMLGLTYFNAVKNVAEWASKLKPEVWKQTITDVAGNTKIVPALWDVPFIGRLPGIDFLHFTPVGWFNLTWALLTLACIYVVYRHFKNPLPIIPASPLAKGQIIYLVILWIMIVANFERALVGWHPARLLTEWIITLNAIIATALILTLRPKPLTILENGMDGSKKLYRWFWLRGIAVFLLSALLFLATNRLIYHYPEYDKLNLKQYHSRFGPEASWKSKPNLKNAEHK